MELPEVDTLTIEDLNKLLAAFENEEDLSVFSIQVSGSILPSAELSSQINTLLKNYENTVHVAINAIEEDLCSINAEYRTGVIQKFKEEAKLRALLDSKASISKNISQTEEKIKKLELKHNELVETHRMGSMFDKLKHKIEKDRNELGINQVSNQLRSENYILNPMTSSVLDRINKQISDQSVHAASIDNFDRANTPIVLYLRRFRHDEERKANASASELLETIQIEREGLSVLKNRLDSLDNRIAINRQNLTDLISKFTKKRSDILSTPEMIDESNRRRQEFTTLLKDIRDARKDYLSEEEKKALLEMRVDVPPPPVLSPEPINGPKRQSGKIMNPSGVRDIDIVLAALNVFGEYMTSAELIQYANNHFPNWQSGRNGNNPDQAKRSLRSAWHRITEIDPNDKHRRTLKPKNQKQK